MLTVLRPRLVPNSTWPAASANSVSSPPRPTRSPGWKWVPRWRTMISPALTSWPPKRFTPSRWALESRPLREDSRPSCAPWSATPRSAGLDAGHAQPRQLLAVPLTRVLPGLVLELVDADLRSLDRPDDLGRDRAAASASASVVTLLPSTSRRAGRVTLLPGSPSRVLTSTSSPTATRYCRPPVFTIAYTAGPTSLLVEVRALRAARAEGARRAHRPSTLPDRARQPIPGIHPVAVRVIQDAPPPPGGPGLEAPGRVPE